MSLVGVVAKDSFVHTWIPEECDKLMMENLNKVGLPKRDPLIP